MNQVVPNGNQTYSVEFTVTEVATNANAIIQITVNDQVIANPNECVLTTTESEDFICEFSRHGTGQGSLVEFLPDGASLNLDDMLADLEYFQSKVSRSLAVPKPLKATQGQSLTKSDMDELARELEVSHYYNEFKIRMNDPTRKHIKALGNTINTIAKEIDTRIIEHRYDGSMKGL